jgi:polar amino acid transport system substrate-binding protein
VPFEPLQYYKNGKTFTGLDIDLLTGIASRLGLTSNPVNTDYNTVVAALESGKCDLIVSDQYVTAARQKQVNMVAYWKSNETVIVPAGNPKHVTDEKHLCGLSVAGENGGLEIQILQGLSKTCQHNGQKPIDIQQDAKSPQALQALLSGHVQAWMASELTAETIQATGHVAMQILKPFPTPATVGGLVAMSFVKARPTVMNAVLKALAAMQSDGAYKSVFATYKMSALMVSPHLVNSTS